MPNPDKILDVRTALVAAGIRTIAYSFDGSGDSGSLEGLQLPADPSRALETFRESGLEGSFSTGHAWDNTTHSYQPLPGLAATYTTIDEIDPGQYVLEHLAYAALEHFDGDWVNNDGGWGLVAIDLLSGEFIIEGNQRYSDSSPANSDGALLEPITVAALDVTTILRNTLG